LRRLWRSAKLNARQRRLAFQNGRTYQLLSEPSAE
jgi:hypothetical protein